MKLLGNKYEGLGTIVRTVSKNPNASVFSSVCAICLTTWEGLWLCLPVWNTVILLKMWITRINEVSKQENEIKHVASN